MNKVMMSFLKNKIEELDCNKEITNSDCINNNDLVMPDTVSNLRLGGFLVIDNIPCIIIKLNRKEIKDPSYILAIGLFDNELYDCTLNYSKQIYIPIVKQKLYTLLSYDNEDYACLMSNEGEIKENLKIPNQTDCEKNTYLKIIKGIEENKTIVVNVLFSMGFEKIIEATISDY